MHRTSWASFVVPRFRLDDGSEVALFLKHRKWGDWGLVGGHVEPGEEGAWLTTCAREIDEEMPSFRYGQDYELRALRPDPMTWGPVRSRSARGQATVYTAQFFALHCLHDPTRLLAALPHGEFAFADRTLLAEERRKPTGLVADPFLRILAALPGGLEDIPLAWPQPISSDVIPFVTPQDRPTPVANR